MKFVIILLLLTSQLSCSTLFQGGETIDNKEIMVDVLIPFMKNSSNECYYLDEFMPSPDALVTGETNGIKLRYYTYLHAVYKEYTSVTISLYFYSTDDTCWSLFEESYQNN